VRLRACEYFSPKVWEFGSSQMAKGKSRNKERGVVEVENNDGIE
jgi:hypothetical protein